MVALTLVPCSGGGGRRRIPSGGGSGGGTIPGGTRSTVGGGGGDGRLIPGDRRGPIAGGRKRIAVGKRRKPVDGPVLGKGILLNSLVFIVVPFMVLLY